MAEKPDESAQVAAIRTFNRFYTGIIGLLNEGMHKSPHSLAEARLIHEIGKRVTTTSTGLAVDLAMDRGQMSRLVWRLIDQGLLAISPHSDDRRSNTLALTPDGDSLYRKFNEMSDEAAADLLVPLDSFLRRDLVSSMRRIETILAEPNPAEPLILRPHRVGELGWLVHRQGLLYHLEQGWNGEFEALIARIYADYEAAPATPPKSLWVAEMAGQVAGSLFIVPSAADPAIAQLRMLYVEPAFRGHGIGKRLVDEAVRFSRASGYSSIMLWTQDCLAAARKIYQGAGFVLEREEPHHSFGADLNGQYWRLDLKR